MNDEAAERTVIQLGGAVLCVLVAAILASCVLGPVLADNWTPDIAVGIWAGIAAVAYAMYRRNRRYS